VKNPQAVNVEASVVFFFRYLQRWLVLITCTSIVDQDVKLAPLLGDGLDSSIPVRTFRHVHLLCDGGVWVLSRDLFSARCVDITDEHFGALREKQGGDRSAKAGSSSYMVKVSVGLQLRTTSIVLEENPAYLLRGLPDPIVCLM